MDGRLLGTWVPQVRCPGCRATTTLLPDAMLPWVQYSLDSIGAGVQWYVRPGIEGPGSEEPRTSYRTVVLKILGETVPAGLFLTGYLGGVEAPPLGPSHIFRWVTRFSAGAEQWWPVAAAETQAQLDHALSTPSAPESIEAKGRSPEKSQNLARAWMLLWVLRFLLTLLGRPTNSWPYALLHLGRRPRLLDHTGWFAMPARAPP